MSSTHKFYMLRCIASEPRTFKFFSEGAVHATVAARHLETYLAEMQAAGLIAVLDGKYFPTDAGIAELTKPTTKAEPKTWCACSTEGTYKPKAWPVRAGGADHEQYRSLGFGA